MYFKTSKLRDFFKKNFSFFTLSAISYKYLINLIEYNFYVGCATLALISNKIFDESFETLYINITIYIITVVILNVKTCYFLNTCANLLLKYV